MFIFFFCQDVLFLMLNVDVREIRIFSLISTKESKIGLKSKI